MSSLNAASIAFTSRRHGTAARFIASAALALGVSAGIGLGASAALANPQVTIRAGESEPVKRWVRAVEAGDAMSIAAMNGPKTVAYVPNAMVTIGTEAITAGYAGMFEKYHAKVKIKDAQYISAGGLVHSWGLYSLTLSPKAGGSPVTMEGRFSDIATNVNGRWQYIMDHASLPSK